MEESFVLGSFTSDIRGRHEFGSCFGVEPSLIHGRDLSRGISEGEPHEFEPSRQVERGRSFTSEIHSGLNLSRAEAHS